MGREMRQREMVMDGAYGLNKGEELVISNVLIITHPARCNAQRRPDYPVMADALWIFHWWMSAKSPVVRWEAT